MNKTGTSLILLLIICFVIIKIPKQVTGNTENKTIVVPDDFATLQEAINNASKGDTVFVKKGIYTDLALLNKSISLIGENKETTIIDSTGIESRVYIEANYVTITGFTIKNADSHGIRLGLIEFEPDSEYQPIGCKIIGNNIENNKRGIYVRGGSEHIISENNITKNETHGIELHSSKTIILRNNILNNGKTGITINQSRKVIIKGNSIKNNGQKESGTGGINLRSEGPFYIYGNNITDNHIGIQFDENCNNASISKNNIEKNDVGVDLKNFLLDNSSIGTDNIVYFNNFIDNTKQVVINKEYYNNESIENIFSFNNGTDRVSWDNGKKGNYWNNFKGIDNNGDGISNIPFIINEKNQDKKPSMQLIEIPKIKSGIMSLEEASLAVNLEIQAKSFIGARKIAELTIEPYILDSGIKGILLWLASNGTIYQAEYPTGNILGKYLVTHEPYWNSLEGSYIWNLNYENSETVWIEATNGTILQDTNFLFEKTIQENQNVEEPKFELSNQILILIGFAVIAIIGATLFYGELKKTNKTTSEPKSLNL